MIKTSLVLLAGAPDFDRIGAVAAVLDQFSDQRPASVLYEGGLAPAPLLDYPDVKVQTLGFGCPCCVGALPLRVSLTRVLRQHPKLIVVAALASPHLDRLAAFIEHNFGADLSVIARPVYTGGPRLAL